MSRSYPGLAAGAALMAVWGLPAIQAEAHSMYIFAFPQGSQICTSSYFGGQGKVRGGQVALATTSGEILATALTDAQGQACFDRPKPNQDMIFTVEASGGHRAEFKLPALDQEVDQALDQAVGQAARPAGPATTAKPEAAAEDQTTAVGSLTERDLQRALAPVVMKLAEMESRQNSRVDLKDIIGGLGWIIGLAGAALWAASWKNAARPREKS